jgi:peptide/nickel transport system ATP-binding protein
MDSLVSVRNLTVTFPTKEGAFKALDDVCFDIGRNEHVAVIGESGCGKSVLGHSIMCLLDDISETQGEIFFEGNDLRAMSEHEINSLRGKNMALIPQSPTLSLDPVMKIGKQIAEMYTIHGISKAEARESTVVSLGDVGFTDPVSIYNTYPHRMSGGMCERAVIAMGMSLGPSLLIADEPTKGLDPESKLQVLREIRNKSRDRALILITHDYNAVRICERTVVMYLGRIIEDGPTEEILSNPRHPYTKALWKSMPVNGLEPIPGFIEKADGGCDFCNRCPQAGPECSKPQPMKSLSEKHYARCWRA